MQIQSYTENIFFGIQNTVISSQIQLFCLEVFNDMDYKNDALNILVQFSFPQIMVEVSI